MRSTRKRDEHEKFKNKLLFHRETDYKEITKKQIPSHSIEQRTPYQDRDTYASSEI